MIYNLENTVEVGKPIRVFLDGVELTQVIHVDTELRLIRRYKTDEMGMIVIDCVNQAVLQEEFTYGPEQLLEVKPKKEAGWAG